MQLLVGFLQLSSFLSLHGLLRVMPFSLEKQKHTRITEISRGVCRKRLMKGSLRNQAPNS
jgi:hypothetical protein